MLNLELILTMLSVIVVASLLWWVSWRFMAKVLPEITFSNNIKWDDYLAENHFFKALTLLVPITFIYITWQILYPESYDVFASKVFTLSTVIIFGLILISLIKSFGAFYESKQAKVKIPVKGYIGIFQLFIILGLIIISASIIYDLTLWKILSGLGAVSAVLLLILKDTLLSFGASLQLLGHKMAGKDDWVEVKSFRADGIIEDITLYFVKIRNWDNSIINIPLVSFVESSFVNWQGVYDKNSRRIMRSILIDLNSIKFLSDTDIKQLLDDAIVTKHIKNIEPETTNLEQFTTYIENYLKAHEKIVKQDKDILLIRQLDPTAEGLPLQVYAYSTSADWIPHELIQNEVFNHIIAIMPKFSLCSFQNISDRNNALI